MLSFWSGKVSVKYFGWFVTVKIIFPIFVMPKDLTHWCLTLRFRTGGLDLEKVTKGAIWLICDNVQPKNTIPCLPKLKSLVPGLEILLHSLLTRETDPTTRSIFFWTKPPLPLNLSDENEAVSPILDVNTNYSSHAIFEKIIPHYGLSLLLELIVQIRKSPITATCSQPAGARTVLIGCDDWTAGVRGDSARTQIRTCEYLKGQSSRSVRIQVWLISRQEIMCAHPIK